MAQTSDNLKPEDFENLERYHIYTSLASGGTVQPWVSGITQAPPKQITNPYKIIENSRQNYGVNANEIDSSLNSLVSQPESASKVPLGDTLSQPKEVS
jgi:hypothetical protein